jgi:hypothetical protein
MIALKQNPKGIDTRIQNIQKALYAKLCALWSMPEVEYNCYGRAYRNQDEEGRYIPEVYTGQQNKEYDDPLLNDAIYCTSFFGRANRDDEITGDLSKAHCHLIFCLNVQKIKPSVAHRGDEEIHVDALRTLQQMAGQLDIVSLEQWADTVFKEYTGYKARKGMEDADMHPYHYFRINFTTTFKNNC